MTRFLLMLALALACSPVLAGGSPSSTPSDDEILARSKEIMTNAQAHEAAAEIARGAASAIERAETEHAGAFDVFEESTRRAIADSKAMFGAKGHAMLEATGEAREWDQERPVRYRVFVSQSMPREEIRQLVELSRDRQDIAIVFRGVKPGQKINDLFAYILDLMGGVQENDMAPSVAIDPEQFRQIGTLMVPTLARYDDAGALVAQVSGVTSVEWLDAEIERGRRGNIGQFGSVVEVVEEDMIAAMQEKARQINLEGAGERAVNRYFSNLHQEVAVATVPRVRTLDPSFVVEETISLPTGEVLAEAGTVINPLDEHPFTSAMVVFDPTDPRQMAVAREQLRRFEGRNVMLLASTLAHTEGLGGYAQLVNDMGRHVFFLTQEVRSRFDIQTVPAVVTAEGRLFRIEEIPPTN